MESLPEEVFTLVCGLLRAGDLIRLLSCSWTLHRSCTRARIWRREYWRRFLRRVEPCTRLLGSGSFYDAYRHDAFNKAAMRQGRVLDLDLAAVAGGVAVMPGKADQSVLLMVSRDGGVLRTSLASEGKVSWEVSTVAVAGQLAQEEQRLQRREELSQPHKNSLLRLKIHAEELESGFELWDFKPPSNERREDAWDEAPLCRSASSGSSLQSGSSSSLGGGSSSGSSSSLGSTSLGRLARSASLDSTCSDNSSSTTGSSSHCSAGQAGTAPITTPKVGKKGGKKGGKHRLKASAAKSKGRRSRGSASRQQRTEQQQQQQQQQQFVCMDGSQAVVELTDSEWYAVTLGPGKAACAQRHLIPPRWLRHGSSPLRSAAFARDTDDVLGGLPFACLSGDPTAAAAVATAHCRGRETPPRQQGQQGQGQQGQQGQKEQQQQQKQRDLVAATGHEDGAVLLWSSDGYASAVVTGRGPVLALRLSQRRVLTGHGDGAVLAWEPRSGRRLRSMQPSMPGAVEELRVEGDLVVARSRDAVMVWRHSGKLLQRLDERATSLACWRADDDTLVLAVGCECGKIVVRRLPAKQTPGPTTLSGKSGGGIREEVEVVEEEERGAELRGHDGAVLGLHLDAYRLVSCGEDGTVKVWEVGAAEGRAVRTLKWKRKRGGHGAAAVSKVVVGPSFIAGARVDGTLVAFTFQSGWAATAACDVLSDPPAVAGDAPGAPATTGTGTGTGTGGAAAATAATATPTPTRRKAGGGSSRKRNPGLKGRSRSAARNDDLVEMMFDDAFDEFDLQVEHDYHNRLVW